MATATEVPLLTAEEYARLPDAGRPTELVRGRIVEMTPPYPYHGYVCVEVAGLLRDYVRQHQLGRVFGNDSGVVTQRGPDTVRGADVAFYSYRRLPPGPMPRNCYFPEPPELAVEVLSPSDRWREVLEKVNEYLKVGVLWVWVLDPEARAVTVFHADQRPRVLSADDELTLPELLGDFRARVRQFFE